MPCIECGEEENKFNYLCQNCYIKSNPIIDTKLRLKLSLCKDCYAPSIKNDIWYDLPKKTDYERKFLINKAIVELIDFKYKIKPLGGKKIELTYIDSRIYDLNEKTDIVEGMVNIKGIPDLFLPEISVNEKVTIFIKYKKCKNCQLLTTGGAIKAKVQIRCIKNLLDVVDETISKFYNISQGSEIPEQYPLEESKLKDGWDLSFKSKKDAELLVNHFKNVYGAHIIETKETTSYDRIKNKARSRIVYSVRLPSYLIGDIIILEDNPYQVLEITSNQSGLYNFMEKNVYYVDNEILMHSNMKNIYSKNDLAKYMVISIDKYSDSLQLMNLLTFDVFEYKIDKLMNIQENEEIYGFFWNDNLYISRFKT